MPSAYCVLPPTPPNVALVLSGMCASFTGKLTGSLPLGLTSPDSRATRDVPAVSPGYHVSSSAGVSASQGMSTAEPVSSTTTVRGLAASTASIRRSWSPGSWSDTRSRPSASVSETTTMATWAWRADSAASSMLAPLS